MPLETRSLSPRDAALEIFRPLPSTVPAMADNPASPEKIDLGKALFFDFKYVTLNTGVKVWGKRGGRSSARRVQRDQVYPALNFFIKPTQLPR